MKYIYTILLALLSFTCYSQLAIIYDKDGYTNVRSSGSKGNNIVDTLVNGRFILCLEDQGNWTNIDYTKGKDLTNGWVYKDRYHFISHYPAVPAKVTTSKSIHFIKDSIEVTILTKPFEKGKHSYQYFKDNKSVIATIDNRENWGTDGELPKEEYKSITIRSGKDTLRLPASAIQSLYQPNLRNTQVNIDTINNVIYVHSLNGDGAGGYYIAWKIEGGYYKGRFVAHGF